MPGHQVGGLPICRPYHPSFEISQAQLLPGADILPGLELWPCPSTPKTSPGLTLRTSEEKERKPGPKGHSACSTREDPSSIPRSPGKKLDVGVHAYNPSTGEADTGDSVAQWSASLA